MLTMLTSAEDQAAATTTTTIYESSPRTETHPKHVPLEVICNPGLGKVLLEETPKTKAIQGKADTVNVIKAESFLFV